MEKSNKVEPLEVYKLTASQLTSLLQILGALVADYISNPKGPMDSKLKPYVKSVLQWKDLPILSEVVQTAVKGGDKLSHLYELGTEIKALFPDFKANRAYTTPELRMLNALRSYLMTDSELALKYIRTNASIFGSPELAAVFAPPIPKADNKALKRTVMSLVGRDGTHLTREEAEMVKATNPEEYELYMQHRKAHNAEFKATLANLIRKSGKDKADYQEIYKQIVAMGFTHSMVPGFQGLIDDKGNWYTKDGEALGGIPNLSTYTHVAMNDGRDPEANWIYKAYKADGDFAYGYTSSFKRSQSSAKYEHVAELMARIDEIQANWRQKIKKWNPADKLCVSAVVLEILYTYAARIGSAPGRGAGTILVKNTSVTQAGVNIAYIGKDQIPAKHIIRKADSPEQALLVKRLIELIADKKPSMFVFTVNVNGRLLRVTPGDVNKAFHTFGAPETLGVHKLRTARGTTMFKQLMDKDAETRRPPSTEKDALARYKAMTEKVGDLLNHKRGVGTENIKVTGVTSALSYIDGDLQSELWARWGFRPPAFLEKLLRDDS